MDNPRPESQSLSRSRLGWYLVGWLALSSLALIAVVSVHRPKQPGVDGLGQPRPARSRPGPTGDHLTAGGSSDWSLRLYYTAVERFYSGGHKSLSGCVRPTCSGGLTYLGAYPATFLAAVRQQGSGEICSGRYTRHFLNWSSTIGYWIDTAPRTADGRQLRRFTSAESGTPQLSPGTALRILGCGAGSRPGSGGVCTRLQTTTWHVAQVAAARPDRTIGLYVGLQTGSGFAASAWAGRFRHVLIRIG